MGLRSERRRAGALVPAPLLMAQHSWGCGLLWRRKGWRWEGKQDIQQERGFHLFPSGPATAPQAESLACCLEGPQGLTDRVV